MNPTLRRPSFEDVPIDVSADVTAGSYTDLYTFTVPAGCYLELEDFGNDIDVVGAWKYVYWQFLRDGLPMVQESLDAIYDQMGYAAQRQKIYPAKIMGGGKLTVRAYNNYTGPVNMVASFRYKLYYR
jgi:hypothetical protein